MFKKIGLYIEIFSHYYKITRAESLAAEANMTLI